jgi:hypothetical protein
MNLYIYILLGLLISWLELRRRFSGQPLDAMTAFNCYYFVLFVFVPINVIFLGAAVVRQQYAYETFGPGDVSTALCLFFSYVLFCLGYWLKSSKGSKAIVRGARDCFSLRDSTRVAKAIFFVGVLLTAIYAIQIGGIFEVISRAGEVRSGEFVIESKYIGYRHLSQFSADAFVLFVAVILGKRAKKIELTTRDWAFVLSAFLFFVYYALSTGGRRPFINPIILCYLVYSSLGGRLKKATAVAFVLVFLIAGLGSMLGSFVPLDDDASLSAVARTADENLQGVSRIAYDNATQGLADSYIHFVGAQKAHLWQFGFLTDIASLPRDFFPSQLLGFQRTGDMYDAVTEYFLGHPLVEGLSGQETLGIHGYLLVNFGYMGMFALFFVLGLFYKWIHTRFKPVASADAVGWLVYWWAILGFFVYFREGVVILVLKAQLTWWLTIALLLYYRRKRQLSAPRRLRDTSQHVRGFSDARSQQT